MFLKSVKITINPTACQVDMGHPDDSLELCPKPIYRVDSLEVAAVRITTSFSGNTLVMVLTDICRLVGMRWLGHTCMQRRH